MSTSALLREMIDLTRLQVERVIRRDHQGLIEGARQQEALLKALGIGLRQVRWTDAEVVRDDLGRPSLRLSHRLAEIAAERGATRIHLSLSHTQEYAVAQVVIEG